MFSLLLVLNAGIGALAATDCETNYGGKCIGYFSSCSGTIESASGVCGFMERCCVPRVTGPTTPPPTMAPVENCGATEFEARTRIVGGGPSIRGSWPWQVSIQYKGKHICGGTLLNNLWIASAAHCFLASKTTSLYKVKIGAHKFGETDGKTYGVSKIITSDKWRGVTGSILGDLTMVKLTSSVEMSSDYVNAACLPDDNDKGDKHVDNEECWVSGWGMTNGYVKQLPSTLQQVNAPILTNKRCNAYSYGWAGKVKSSQICFGTGQTKEGACRGDSGGPLVCRRDGRYNLIGVVSWGTPYCQGKPSVFTRVTEYVPWMVKTMKDN